MRLRKTRAAINRVATIKVTSPRKLMDPWISSLMMALVILIVSSIGIRVISTTTTNLISKSGVITDVIHTGKTINIMILIKITQIIIKGRGLCRTIASNVTREAFQVTNRGLMTK